GLVSKGSGFAYSVSKLGVLHLVSMAADDVRGTGVTVNCVVPSIIDTPVNRAAMPSANHDRWPKVPDVARTYLFLAAPESGLVNGAAIRVGPARRRQRVLAGRRQGLGPMWRSGPGSPARRGQPCRRPYVYSRLAKRNGSRNDRPDRPAIVLERSGPAL